MGCVKRSRVVRLFMHAKNAGSQKTLYPTVFMFMQITQVWTSLNPGIFLITAIECPSPLPPTSGRLLSSNHHLVGHTVQYVCDDGFVLIGEPIIRCTEAGLWSHAPPFCKFLWPELHVKIFLKYNLLNIKNDRIFFTHNPSNGICGSRNYEQSGVELCFLYGPFPASFVCSLELL